MKGKLASTKSRFVVQPLQNPALCSSTVRASANMDQIHIYYASISQDGDLRVSIGVLHSRKQTNNVFQVIK
jgi:hypothetical protein